MAELIAAKQTYTDYTLAKNEHKLTRIGLKPTYAAAPEVYAEDWAQLVSQSSPGAAAWLGISPSWACILTAASAQPLQYWKPAYSLRAGVYRHSTELFPDGCKHCTSRARREYTTYPLTLSHLLSAKKKEIENAKENNTKMQNIRGVEHTYRK